MFDLAVKKTWDFDKEGPSLNGKVIFVTGGTAGLGATTVQRFATKGPAHIYFSGRNATAAEAVIEQTKASAPAVGLTFVPLDQSDLSSVSEAIDKHFQSDRLDILVLNAGIMAVPKALSKDGYEIHFAVNYLAHALITKKLLPALLKTAQSGGDPRVVSLTSLAWGGHPKGGIQFDRLKSTQEFTFIGPWLRYAQSKLANILLAAELARRHPEITAVSIHPGVVDTGLVKNQGLFNKAIIHVPNLFTMVSEEDGTLNTTWAATIPKEKLENGAMYYPVGIHAQDRLDKAGKDVDLARRLWDFTEEALSPFASGRA